MSVALRLERVFAWIEERDLRVGEIWLNPAQVVELAAEKQGGWDPIRSHAVRVGFMETKGALYAGYLWGARVFESEIIPKDHVAALPSGFETKIIDGTGAMSF